MNEMSNEQLNLVLEFAPSATDWDNYTLEQWVDFVNNSYPSTIGKSTTAGKLMMAFAEGVKEVKNEYERKKYQTSLKNKPIALYNAPDGPQAVQHKSELLDLVGVEKNFLSEFLQFDPEDVLTVADQKDNVIFEGTVLQLFRSFGIEEAHHSVFTEKKGEVKENVSRLASHEEYDAQQHEFRALLWQLRDQLKNNNLDSAAITRKRIEDARVYRKQKMSTE